jgi:hypothetical protein
MTLKYYIYVLSTLLLNFALEYIIEYIRKVQETLMGHIGCLSVYDDNVNLLRDNIDTIKKNT